MKSLTSSPPARERNPLRRHLLLGAIITLVAPIAGAATTGGKLSTGNPFLDAFVVALMLGVVWALFYWTVYPGAVRRFGESSARSIFWSGFTLWALTLIYFSLFFVYTYGFFHLWIQWTLPILVLLTTIWFFLASFVRN